MYNWCIINIVQYVTTRIYGLNNLKYANALLIYNKTLMLINFATIIKS